MAGSQNGEIANGFIGECKFHDIQKGSKWFIFISKAPLFFSNANNKQSSDL